MLKVRLKHQSNYRGYYRLADNILKKEKRRKKNHQHSGSQYALYHDVYLILMYPAAQAIDQHANLTVISTIRGDVAECMKGNLASCVAVTWRSRALQGT